MAQSIDDVKDDPEGSTYSSTSYASSTETNRRLRFVGTVELGGAVTGQMLGILFGPDSNVDGRLQFDGAVEIEGTYKGAIKTSDVLKVGEQAVIEADITCGSAIVKGQITGNIVARDSVTLQQGARVKGDITSPTMSMERGATFDGLSRMGTVASEPQPSGKHKRNGRQPYTP
jgi:cytoskeletal protein CcmA (bactofilin family)